MQGVHPKAKARPEPIGAEQSGLQVAHVDARLAVEERQPEEPEEMQPHQDDEDAADDRQRAEIAGDRACR